MATMGEQALGDVHATHGGTSVDRENIEDDPSSRVSFQRNTAQVHRGAKPHPKGKNLTRKNTPASLPTVSKIKGMPLIFTMIYQRYSL